MNDLLKPERFTLLWEDMRDQQIPGRTDIKDRYENLTETSDKKEYALFLKKIGKKGTTC